MISRRTFLRVSLAWPFMAPWAGPVYLLQAAGTKDGQREEMLSKGRPTTVESLADAVVIKHENLFFVAKPDGSVPLQGNHGHGLYYHDCRYLNGYELRIGGMAPAELSATAADGSIGIFTLTNPRLSMPDGTVLDKEEIGITWRRVIDSETPALRDRLHFRNFTIRRVEFAVSLTFQSVFEDIYEIRGLVPKRYGTLHDPAWEDGALRFQYDGKDGVYRRLAVHSSPTPRKMSGTTAEFHIGLGPRESDQLNISLILSESKDRHAAVPTDQPKFGRLASALQEEKREWMSRVAEFSSHGSSLDEIMERSFRALRVLRTHLRQQTFYAAGVPWFVTLFGRDSLITALQTLAFHSDIAEETLRLLAMYQGTRVDDWRDEEPGKILHELRVGELANLDVIPHTPFYGTVDATPLFLILMARHAAWTGTLILFHELRRHVEQALLWMDTYGTRWGLPYLTYMSRSDGNLVNQGWKDSGDAIVNADGRLAKPPIALVEVQGYGYLAKQAIADLYARSGDHERARRLHAEAEALRRRFNRDFWMEEKDCYALALQAEGRPAAVVSSNPGQALWTGIADSDKAERTIQRLMAGDMFNGWGVRTLSDRERAYNPIGYHLGTVWPHDNSIIAAGFRRYGRDREALRIFDGLFSAAFHFRDHQLPEVFCGFGREDYQIPVNYPVACHPQAWAAGSMPFLVETLLGLTPEAFEHRLRIVHPILPHFLDRLQLRRLRVGAAAADLEFYRDRRGVHVEVLRKDGPLEVVVETATE
ncbi:MAG TPA: glycogen debranching N-terminal domain-containing protein [Nitrospiraceae bacterium]|nr:glycogen debranching N-terminal domain-containing protein [Nitrospiraceae bacterium]